MNLAQFKLIRIASTPHEYRIIVMLELSNSRFINENHVFVATICVRSPFWHTEPNIVAKKRIQHCLKLALSEYHSNLAITSTQQS